MKPDRQRPEISWWNDLAQASMRHKERDAWISFCVLLVGVVNVTYLGMGKYIITLYRV